MAIGFVIFPRELRDEPVFKDPFMWQLFSYFVMKASYKEESFPIRRGNAYTTVTTQKGQLITGRKAIAEALYMDGSKVYRKWKKLDELGYTTTESNNLYSTVTIRNYERYQGQQKEGEHPSEQEGDNEQTGDGQRANTPNNPKNINKEKKKIVPFPYNIPEQDAWEIYNGIPLGGAQEENAKRLISDYVPVLSPEEIDQLADIIKHTEEKLLDRRFLENLIRETIAARSKSQAVGGG